MPAHAVDLARRFRARIEDKGAEHGLIYPWWIAVLSTTAIAAAALLAAAQRDAVLTPRAVLVAVLVVVAPCIADFVLRAWLPWWIELVVVTVGAVWLLRTPVVHGDSGDAVSAVFAVCVGKLTACEGAVRGLAASVVGCAVMLAVAPAPAESRLLYVGAVAFGFVIGGMLRWQMRALAAERLARREEHDRATLAERQRVAHEIHDLVAHSLSVTMLHVTGARRALTEDADVADAVEALTDAERIGRQAMADIRRTVGLLATDRTSSRSSLPGVGDLGSLVDDVRAAGLSVDFQCSGDLGALPEAAGLGLYRVVQESLANATKHAPGAPVEIRLRVGRHQTRLTVTNRVTGPERPRDGGTGLVGMASRATQLGGRLDAGREGDQWRVRLAVPRSLVR